MFIDKFAFYLFGIVAWIFANVIFRAKIKKKRLYVRKCERERELLKESFILLFLFVCICAYAPTTQHK